MPELLASNNRVRELENLLALVPASALATAATSVAKRPPESDTPPSTEMAPAEPEESAEVREAREAIAELRNPSAPPEPGESLTDIVRRNNWQRQQLESNQRASNTLISRIASALQVDRWDADGTEILEKAQRFSVFAHFLSKRLKAIVATIPENTTVPTSREEIARMNELRTIISALVAPPAVSKFLHEKSPAKVTPAILDTAVEGKPPLPPEVNRNDLLTLRDAWAAYVVERGFPPTLNGWLTAAAKSEVAMRELADLINIFLLPTLHRMKLSTGGL